MEECWMSLLEEKTWYSSGEVCRIAGLSLRQLHYWGIIGIVEPRWETHGARNFCRYSKEDLQLLKNIKRLIEEGYTLRAAARKAKAREEKFNNE